MSKVKDKDIEALMVKPDVEEEPKQPNPAEKYSSLTDYYADAILSFGFMISRTMPEKFKGKTDAETETLSCKAGIVAFTECIEILKKQMTGTPNIITDIENTVYISLAKYYEDSFIQFVGDISLDIPEKFHKGSDDATMKKSCKAAIAAFKRNIETLKEEVGGA